MYYDKLLWMFMVHFPGCLLLACVNYNIIKMYANYLLQTKKDPQ